MPPSLAAEPIPPVLEIREGWVEANVLTATHIRVPYLFQNEAFMERWKQYRARKSMRPGYNPSDRRAVHEQWPELQRLERSVIRWHKLGVEGLYPKEALDELFVGLRMPITICDLEEGWVAPKPSSVAEALFRRYGIPDKVIRIGGEDGYSVHARDMDEVDLVLYLTSHQPLPATRDKDWNLYAKRMTNQIIIHWELVARARLREAIEDPELLSARY